MKFKINGTTWKIKELKQDDIKKELKERYNNKIEDEPTECGRYFGVTYHDNQIIYIDKDLPTDRKKKTLIHELMHCYIGCYITHQVKTYDEEMVCDISSNSYDMIHKIVEDYFNKRTKC